MKQKVEITTLRDGPGHFLLQVIIDGEATMSCRFREYEIVIVRNRLLAGICNDPYVETVTATAIPWDAPC